MNIEIINPLDFKAWDDLVLLLPDSSFFHSSAWARVLHESYRYVPLYFSVLEGNQLRAVLPVMEVNSFITGRRGVSLPFTDYCDPMVDDDINLRWMVEYVINYGKKAGWKYLELRGGKDFLEDAVASATYVNHTLHINGDSRKLLSGFRNSTQRNIRKAEKEGVTATLSNSMEAVLEFCRLNSISRKYHGLPPQPIRFFEAIHRHIISRGLGFVVLASHGGETIAGSIFFLFGNKGLYKLGAFDLEQQRLRPNNLVMWKAIEWLSENGYESLDFGRTELEHTGLLQYKAGWRPAERYITYHRFDMKKDSFVGGSPTSRIQRMVFSRIPIPILNLIGSLGYRHVG